MRLILQLVVSLQCAALYQTQRVAPGVPPQHYAQNQHGQMQQQVPQYQVPVQHHQPPPQQQQLHQPPPPQQQLHQQPHHVPVQQQQQQLHHQPPPPQQQQQQHHHHAHPSQGQLLNAANIAHEKDHIVEHMEVPMDTSKMSEQELQFHYFKMHDADNNNKLDGCELIKSLIHWHEQGGKDRTQQAQEEKIFKDEELVALIDPILGMDDGNRDGYIDYPEFVRAQQKAAASAKAP